MISSHAEIVWERYGILPLITDPGTRHPSKIDTVQNALLLTSDLAAGWADGEFGIDVERGNILIPFTKKYAHLAGKELQTDHITNKSLLPLKQCLTIHFENAINMYFQTN
ncbi:hypothetical protein M422DRAFT_29721 [Sphaerobolus stellatus SS14]|uniref:HNH nuclease domain-containing protein n=1 Tax=Sphaerobolus stellatus (strain SS14) TaxID=990650 RepID=A0A0C9VF02_SPHS4|nr:hypothetical protein M422DRAFT_29721 [Sphaerobolus stellatus SS14]